MRSPALLVLGLVATTALAAGEPRRVEDAGLRYRVPARWERVPAPSDMRAAQYRIAGPSAEDPMDDAEVILFFFGPGQGGGTEANLERWYSQFTQPDGRASRDAAVVVARTVGSARVTSVDLSGTYAPAQMGPGAAKGPRPDTRMLAAVIEGEGGPWFLRVIGPKGTMESVVPEFDQVLGSLEPHQ